MRGEELGGSPPSVAFSPLQKFRAMIGPTSPVGGVCVLNDNSFAMRMSHAPDEELLSVVSCSGFVPAAVDAAKAELARRNINSDELAQINARVEARQRADELRPSIPLSTAGKVGC